MDGGKIDATAILDQICAPARRSGQTITGLAFVTAFERSTLPELLRRRASAS